MDRAKNAIWLLVSVILSCSAFYLYVLDSLVHPLLDFQVYYEAGQRLLRGEDIYNFVYTGRDYNEKIFENSYFYPPFLAWCLANLSYLGFENVKLIWCLLNFISVILSALLFAKLFKETVAKSLGLPFLLAVSLFFLISYEPIYNGLRYGQVNAQILLLLTIFLFFSNRGSNRVAGAALAFAALIKMSPLILIFSQAKQPKKHLLIYFTLVLLVSMSLVCLTVPSFQSIVSFPNLLLKTSSGEVSRSFLFNLSLDKLLTDHAGIPDAYWLRASVKIFFVILFIASFLHFKNRGGFGGYRTVAALVIIMMISSPIIWVHHLTWSLIPLFVYCIKPIRAEAELKAAHYKHWLICISIYFLLSQTQQIHFLALQNAPSLLFITGVQPTATLLFLFILLWRWENEENRALSLEEM